MTTTIRHQAVSLVAALVFSTTCLFAAAGPVRAATPAAVAATR